MKLSSLLMHCAVAGCLLAPSAPVLSAAPDANQTISLQQPLTIPDATLQPGQYSFAVEDHLADRAIIRVTSAADSAQHYLLLAVPNRGLHPSARANAITFRNGKDNGDVLRGYACTECKTTYEIAYPKAQAAKVLTESGQAVVAFDPSYDKLPANLSPDDMKVVTLWLASPKRVSAEHKGEGVALAKLADARPGSDSGAATAKINSSQTGANVVAANHLPKTAGNDFRWGALGFLCLAVAGVLFWRKRELEAAA